MVDFTRYRVWDEFSRVLNTKKRQYAMNTPTVSYNFLCFSPINIWKLNNFCSEVLHNNFPNNFFQNLTAVHQMTSLLCVYPSVNAQYYTMQF